MTGSLAVVKVGGSLYDMPDLGSRLRAWLAESGATSATASGGVYPRPLDSPSAGINPAARRSVLLVPGGGPTADVIRDFDRIHQLGEERAHWLALDALKLNAHFLAGLLPSAAILDSCDDDKMERLRREHGRTFILDAVAFAQWDQFTHPPDALPHCWAVTSDSIAARAAVLCGADRLILLKSATIPLGFDWEEPGKYGFVDPWFARTIRQAGTRLQVGAVNFRDWRQAPAP